MNKLRPNNVQRTESSEIPTCDQTGKSRVQRAASESKIMRRSRAKLEHVCIPAWIALRLSAVSFMNCVIEKKLNYTLEYLNPQ